MAISQYQKIKEYIKNNITSSHYKINSKIPTEHEFASMFNVSRATANKAISDLTSEGFLIRKREAGTFVVKVKAETSILDIENIPDEVYSRGHVYSNRVYAVKKIHANNTIATLLNVIKDQIVYNSIIVHMENGVPIRLDDRYINPIAAPEYIKQDFSKITPNVYLTRVCPLSRMEHKIEAVMPDREIQKYLQINIKEPCLLVNRRTWSKGIIVTYSRLYYPSSRYKLSSNRDFT